MFFNLQSDGFRLKETYLRDIMKIEMLFYILSVCYYISEIVGRVKKIEGEGGVKSVYLGRLRGIVTKKFEEIWIMMSKFKVRMKNVKC